MTSANARDRREPCAARPEAGFTLLEVLAALTVFLVGVVGVMSLFTSGTVLHQRSQRLSAVVDVVDEVLLIAEREIPGLFPAEGAPEADLTDEASASQGLRPVPSNPGISFSYTVTHKPEARSYVLVVQLTWKEGGRDVTHQTQAVLPSLRTFDQEVWALRRQ